MNEKIGNGRKGREEENRREEGNGDRRTEGKEGMIDQKRIVREDRSEEEDGEGIEEENRKKEEKKRSE